MPHRVIDLTNREHHVVEAEVGRRPSDLGRVIPGVIGTESERGAAERHSARRSPGCMSDTDSISVVRRKSRGPIMGPADVVPVGESEPVGDVRGSEPTRGKHPREAKDRRGLRLAAEVIASEAVEDAKGRGVLHPAVERDGCWNGERSSYHPVPIGCKAPCHLERARVLEDSVEEQRRHSQSVIPGCSVVTDPVEEI